MQPNSPPSKIKFVGLFEYAATVVPPRRRNPVRTTLFGRIEYEIDEIHPSEATDAIVFRTQADTNPRIHRGYDGRLWEPLPTYAGGPVDVESYRALMDATALDSLYSKPRARGLKGLHSSDPLSGAAPRLPTPRRDADAAAAEEENAYAFDETFEGEVVWSNRTQSIMSHQAATRDLLSIGGFVHARTAAPHWGVHPNGAIVELEAGNPFLSQQFRLDRLDDAVAFARWRKGLDFPVIGEILEADPRYVSSDDIARALRHADASSLAKIATYAEYLPPRAMAALGLLLRGRHSGNDIDGVADVESFAAAFRTLQEACFPPDLPPDLAETLTGHLGLLGERMRFEREYARTPAGRLSAGDDDALARAAGPRP